MKKVLLATTALALSAGVASAEISLSGSARMGLVYNGKTDAVAAVPGKLTAAEITAVLKDNEINYTAQEAATLLTDLFGPAVQGTYSATGAGMAEALAYRDGLATQVAGYHAAQNSADAVAMAAAEEELALVDAAIAAASGSAAVAAKDSTITFDNRIQLNIDGSVETSSGLTFGARTRIRINENETGAASAPRVYVKSGAVEVAMGNIYGALDSMTGMYDSEVGLTALSDAGVVLNTVDAGRAWGYDGFSSQGKGANGVEVIYSAGAFTGHLSYSDSDMGSNADRVAAYGAYTMNDWTVALGVQDSENNAEDKTVLTVGGKVGDFHVGFAAADNDGVQKIALNGSATFGATTVNGFVADDESGTDTAMGLGVSYDLGGAALVGGVERDATGHSMADMGVSFSF